MSTDRNVVLTTTVAEIVASPKSLQKQFSLAQEKHHQHHHHRHHHQPQQQQQMNGSLTRSNESQLSNGMDKMSPLRTNCPNNDNSTNVISNDISNGDIASTDKVIDEKTLEQSIPKSPVAKSEITAVAEPFYENDKSTNCPSEKSDPSSQMSYETTYPVFTGQTEYGQEGIHVEPFYRYRVYSESKV